MAEARWRFGRRGKMLLAALAALACLCALPARATQPAEAAQRLAALGYVREDAADLSAAVRNFQTANGLEATGTLDTETLSALESDDAVAKRDYLRALAERYPEEPLVSGNISAEVRALQEGLRALGYYSGEADGVYGDATRLAVMAFQTANGLYASGEADRAVLFRLHEGQTLSWDDFIAGKTCARGDSGANVRSLQRRLKRMGYYEGECTDSFGDATQRAVERFQEHFLLTVSGEADVQTCQLLYSGETDAQANDGILREGSSGAEVRALQTLLSGLGYLDVPVNGMFDENTFAAVTLFQIANDFAPTGEADAELMEVMSSQRVVPFSEAVEALRASEASVDAQTLTLTATTASDMLGRAFPAETNELFPGFAFVRYVYARAGVGLSDPGRVVEGENCRPFAPESTAAGEVVAMEFTDESGVQVLYGLSLGGTRLAYADTATGYIVSGDLSSMNYDQAYVWNFSEQ